MGVDIYVGPIRLHLAIIFFFKDCVILRTKIANIQTHIPYSFTNISLLLVRVNQRLRAKRLLINAYHIFRHTIITLLCLYNASGLSF